MKRLLWLLLFFFTVSAHSNVYGASAAPFYAGKVITIIVGFSPGGGYDRLSRLFAKHLPRFIPGKPSVIVQNMPGASSILATNYLYNVARPDGLTIGTFERGLPLVQLLKVPGVKFDLRKFAWVCSEAIEATVLTLRSDFPAKTFAEILKNKTPVILGRTGPADNTAQLAFLLQQFAGLNLTMISYPASPEIMLAIERKEVDGRGGSYSALKPDIERGLVRPYVRSRVSEPGIENLPIDEDFVKDPKAKTIMALRASSEQVGRPYVAPPGTPSQALRILQDAFARASKDPALLEEAQRMRMKVEYLSAAECLKVINFVMNQPDSMVKEFSKYIKF